MVHMAELFLGTGAVVSRLELDGATGTVRGVHFLSSSDNSNTDSKLEPYFVQARREIILCAGAICSAQILLLSGVGPSTPGPSEGDVLDIPLVKELPAVGTKFSDHYSFPIMMEVPKKESLHVLESLLGLWHILLWLFFGKGLLSDTSTSSAFYVRTGAIDVETMELNTRGQEGSDKFDNTVVENIPDIEIMVMPVNGLERHVPGRSLLTLYPTLIQPRATGRVELVSHICFFLSIFFYEMQILLTLYKRGVKIPLTILALFTPCFSIDETWRLQGSRSASLCV